MNKKLLLKKAIALLEEEIDFLDETRKREHELMKDAPSAMQSHSDTTRSQKEALLLGFEKKIRDKQFSLQALKSLELVPHKYVAIGSIIEIYEEEETKYFFIIPGSSGTQLKMNDKNITILSPNSVIAQNILECEEGDLVKVQVPKGLREFEIIAIE